MTIGSQSLHGNVGLHRLPGGRLRLQRSVCCQRILRLLGVRKLRRGQAERGQHEKKVHAKAAGEAALAPSRGESRLTNSIDGQPFSQALGMKRPSRSYKGMNWTIGQYDMNPKAGYDIFLLAGRS